jgi:predicted PurR-regulated permease PerM
MGMQFLIGNLLDPMIMGDRLRLNTITVIFGLLFWGFIWGVPGMLLSVPLMVIIKLILEKSETWSMIARAMGSSVQKQEERLLRIRKRKEKKQDRKNNRS